MRTEYLMAGDGGAVEAWSRTRLPYPPYSAPWLKDFRTQIRTGLSALAMPAGQVLHAEYSSASTGFCDVENVLLYNIGPSAFRHLTHTGVRLERGCVEIPPPDGADPGLIHHYRYSGVDPAAGPKFWTSGPSLIEFRDIRVATLAKIAPIWGAIRRQSQPPIRLAQEHGCFGVRVSVHYPASPPHLNLAERVKVLLDAVISAAHSHNGVGLKEITKRLSLAGAGATDEVGSWLMDDRWAALGNRPLVRTHGTGVQWNPADDQCMFAEVLFDKDTEGCTNWRFTAEIFQLKPRVHSNGPASAAAAKVAVPADDAEEWDLIQFALTFDAVNVLGSFDKVASIAARIRADWAGSSLLSTDLIDLRTALYFEHRRHRNLESDLSNDAFVRSLVRAIDESSGGTVDMIAANQDV